MYDSTGDWIDILSEYFVLRTMDPISFFLLLHILGQILLFNCTYVFGSYESGIVLGVRKYTIQCTLYEKIPYFFKYDSVKSSL